ncbi:hypothetical protein MMPV_004246 [Pyropia vietnamensis]
MQTPAAAGRWRRMSSPPSSGLGGGTPGTGSPSPGSASRGWTPAGGHLTAGRTSRSSWSVGGTTPGSPAPPGTPSAWGEQPPPLNSAAAIATAAAELRAAAAAATARGLFSSAKWAVEMLVALPSPPPSAAATMGVAPSAVPDESSPTAPAPPPPSEQLLLARAYFDAREYRRVAGVLGGEVRYGPRAVVAADAAWPAAPPPRLDGRVGEGDLGGEGPRRDRHRPDEYPIVRFLWAYALYLAGEKRKEEARREDPGGVAPDNEHLPLLVRCLSEDVAEGVAAASAAAAAATAAAEAAAAVGVSPPPPPPPTLTTTPPQTRTLRTSMASYSARWTAPRRRPLRWPPRSRVRPWTELARGLPDGPAAEAATPPPHHWVRGLFLATVYADADDCGAGVGLATELLAALPAARPVRLAAAAAAYNAADYDGAEAAVAGLRADDPYSLDGTEVLSNALYVREDRPGLADLAAAVVTVDAVRPETCVVLGNYYSLRGNHGLAAAHFRRALALNRSFLAAWTLLGHEYVEVKNTGAAAAAYSAATALNARDFRAWYGLGQVYELLGAPAHTLHYYKRAAALRPRDGRMWAGLAAAYEELGRLPDAARCYERVVASGGGDEGLALDRLAGVYERLAAAATTGSAGAGGAAAAEAAALMDLAARNHGAALSRRDALGDGVGAAAAASLLFLARAALAGGRLRDAEGLAGRLLEVGPGAERDAAAGLLRDVHARRRAGAAGRAVVAAGDTPVRRRLGLAAPAATAESGVGGEPSPGGSARRR